MVRQERSQSFHDVDAEAASGLLGQILKEQNVYLGGSCMGKGLRKAAQYYLEKRVASSPLAGILLLPGASNLAAGCPSVNEEPFYIVDIGVLFSQVCQCRSKRCRKAGGGTARLVPVQLRSAHQPLTHDLLLVT